MAKAAQKQTAPAQAPAAPVAPVQAAAPAYVLGTYGAAVTHVALTQLGAGMAQAPQPPHTYKGAPMLPRLAWAVGQALAKAGLPVAAGVPVALALVQPHLGPMGLNASHLQGSGVYGSPKHAKGRASHKQAAAGGPLAHQLPLFSCRPA